MISTGITITIEQAKRIWETISVFAYDSVNECDFQINADDEVMDEALKEADEFDYTLFIEATGVYKLQCIYTYSGSREQEIIDFEILPKEILDDKNSLIEFMRMILNDDEHDELVKISACVSTFEMPPKWFMECNGKFYFKNGKLI